MIRRQQMQSVRQGTILRMPKLDSSESGSFVILLQSLSQMAGMGANDVVLARVEACAALEDIHADLILGDARHSVLEHALRDVYQK
jgi:hypothetical protein